jgi:hypothetical protein
LANSKSGERYPKKGLFLFPVGNINHLWCLRKIERPFKNRIRQQYHGWDWANKEVHMNQQPLPPIIVPCEDPITHVEANGFECDEADCICHWERRSQEQDYETGTHAPDCRCGRCEPYDSPYEPYYSRSDQERDQATADYYDEQQVVLDLRSWETDEAAALAVVQIVNELFTVANAQAPQDRVPCVIHLDEAAYWIPQEAVPYLSKATRLASRGRKLGLTPFLYAQSISEVGKPAIRQAGIKVLMRQTLDIDLNRYCEYIKGQPTRIKKAVQAFPQGKAVVLLPDGTQQVVQFYERVSAHPSHTPRSQAALAKFAATAVDLDALAMRDFTTAAAPAQAEPTLRRGRDKSGPEPKEEKRSQTGKPKHAPLIRDRIYTLLQLNPDYTSRQLAALVGCPQNTAQICRKDYFGTKPPNRSKVEQRIRGLLAENPKYTLSQLAHRANCSYRDV